MSLQTIKFKKIKKIHGHYIERAHINNTMVQFNINDLSIAKTLYKKNKKINLDISIAKTNQRIRRLNKLKQYTVNKVAEAKGTTFEVMEKNYVNKYTETEDSVVLSLEVHPDCQFLKINYLDEQTEDSYKNLKINDTVDILVSFKGILYGKSSFTNKYLIHKVIRYENEEELNLEQCYLEDSESEKEDEDNEEVYSKKLKNRFLGFFDVTPKPVVVEPTIEFIPNEEVVEKTIEVIPEENIEKPITDIQ